MQGIFTSCWVDYAVLKRIPSTEAPQWQIPIGLQLVPAPLLGLGMFTLKESTRWLTKKCRHDEAWESLKWIRADESQVTIEEMEEICMVLRWSVEQLKGYVPKVRILILLQRPIDRVYIELFERDNFKRLATASIVFIAQQATGATAFAYFGP
jgi:hypothetical protein